ncbi:MAG: apolipoprotein N-acyltransferase, partial [Cellvibrionales bacterium]|nr:apolipoprotein N-acyltransferase [Cellvibrionales bacterium]
MKRLTPFLPYLLLLLSAGALIFTLAPFNLWFIAPFALAVFHHSLINASLKQTLYRSFYFGLCFYLLGVHWVWVSIHVHGNAPALLATIMTLGFCAILSFFLILPFGALFYFIKSTPMGRTLGFAAIWLFHEWTSTWIFTGFPWLLLGYSQTESPFSGLAPIMGTMGLSFVIALIAALLSTAKTDYKAQSFQTLTMMMVVMLLFAPFFKNHEWTTKKSNTPYSVAIVQPNYTLEQKWDLDMLVPIREFYQSNLQSLNGTDIILWPESAFTEIYQDAPDLIDALEQTAKAQNTALIFGMPTQWEKNGHLTYYNSIHGVGEAHGMYHKQKLVPFGEYVPFEDQLRGLIYFFDLPLSEFSKGPEEQVFLQAKDWRVAPYICYELVYPDFVSNSASKADLLLTVSNDTWFGQSIGPKQHMQMAQMRALETGRYLIRGTNDGITAVVDPMGRITDQLPQFERGVLKSEVYAMKGLTPLMQYGTLPFLLFSA